MTSVICLPGLLCTPALYDGVLAGVHAAAQAIALPVGEDFVQIAAEVASGLPDRTVLVGTSMGGYLALEIARQFPDRIAGMILIGCTAKADDSKAAALRNKVVTWARREGIDALADTIRKGMLGAAAQEDEIIAAKIAQMAHTQGLDVFARHQTALAGRPDNTDALDGIRCPVLVLTGAEDTITPPTVGREVADALPNGEFALIEGAGHLAVLERPKVVVDAINTFIDQAVRTEAVA